MKRPPIPTVAEVDASHEAGANPRTLCANWRKGCNGVTAGPRNGRLTLCEDCRPALAEAARDRANGNHIDGYDRDDIGLSPDF